MARTPKLSDLQLILLSTAAARDDGNVFPLKTCIAGKTADVAKAVAALLRRNLVAEQLETALVKVWRETEGERIGLVITDAGRALIDGTEGEPSSGAVDMPAPVVPAPTSPAPLRTGSKIDQVLNPREAIRSYVGDNLDQAADDRLLAVDLRQALDELASCMVVERNVFPIWKEMKTWFAHGQDGIDAIRRLVHHGRVVRLGEDGRLA